MSTHDRVMAHLEKISNKIGSARDAMYKLVHAKLEDE
jgi:hypothetical protein